MPKLSAYFCPVGLKIWMRSLRLGILVVNENLKIAPWLLAV